MTVPRERAQSVVTSASSSEPALAPSRFVRSREGHADPAAARSADPATL
jgi:hypothetical protein